MIVIKACRFNPDGDPDLNRHMVKEYPLFFLVCGPQGRPHFGQSASRWRSDHLQDTISHVGTFEAGIVSIAAPLRDMTGEVVAAISLSAHADPETIANLNSSIKTMIKDTADHISKQLGWQKQRST